MSGKKPSPDELMDVVAHMNIAHVASMVALVKALEKTGAVRAEDYEHYLRLASASMASKGEVGAASLLDDLADMMRQDEPTRQ